MENCVLNIIKQIYRRISRVHSFGRVDSVEMLILTKVTYTFNIIPVKIPTASLAEMEQSALKFIYILKGPWKDNNLEKRRAKLEVSYFQIKKNLYYKSTVIKTVWYLHKNSFIDLRNRIGRAQKWTSAYTVKWWSLRVPRLFSSQDHLHKMCWEN